MFLTAVNLAKAKSKTVLVQMVSAAGTGYCFNTKRNRLREKLVLRKNDPLGKLQTISGYCLTLIYKHIAYTIVMLLP
uniref:Large ribosomal subunit protein bL33m n=1 Tax=Hucho hucho TaxID=62062 RepID=A0A4W5RRQ5_9TELE